MKSRLLVITFLTLWTILTFVGGVIAGSTVNAHIRGQNASGHWQALTVDANGNLNVVAS